MMTRFATICTSVLLATTLTATRPAHDPVTPMAADPYAADRADIIAIVDRFFEALEVQDNNTIAALLHEGAVVASVRWDQDGNLVLRQRPERPLPESEDRWVERYWNPVVLVDGSIATFWAPYDFHVNTTFRHCGIDVFNFFKADGEWKIINTTYSVVQDGNCEEHPDGPPKFE